MGTDTQIAFICVTKKINFSANSFNSIWGNGFELKINYFAESFILVLNLTLLLVTIGNILTD